MECNNTIEHNYCTALQLTPGPCSERSLYMIEITYNLSTSLRTYKFWKIKCYENRRENGYPTTEAEKIAADARQRELERAMAERLLSDIKVTRKGG